jgi:hypothetical protein
VEDYPLLPPCLIPASGIDAAPRISKESSLLLAVHCASRALDEAKKEWLTSRLSSTHTEPIVVPLMLSANACWPTTSASRSVGGCCSDDFYYWDMHCLDDSQQPGRSLEFQVEHHSSSAIHATRVSICANLVHGHRQSIQQQQCTGCPLSGSPHSASIIDALGLGALAQKEG